MSLPKHIRIRGLELIKQAAGLGGASFGMPGLTPNEPKNLPEFQALKPMGKGSPQVTGVPNPAVGQQQNLLQANMPKVPNLAANHFMPKLADFPVGQLVSDLVGDLGEQLYLRAALKNKTPMLRKRMRGEEPTVQPANPLRKLGAAMAGGGSGTGLADNNDRIPYGPYRPQNSFNMSGGGDTIQGPGNSVSDKVQDQFQTIRQRLDTWQSDEPSNASSAAGQEGSAYNEPIKSAATVRRSGESRIQPIGGDNRAVDHGIRSQHATYDMTETRGGIGDSPFEGSPRMHDSLVGGRGMTPEDGVTKSFDSLKTPIDTSVMENAQNINDAGSPAV